MKKRVEVKYLPTENDSIICIHNESGTLVCSSKDKFSKLTCQSPQYMYLLSNDEIKEGDWRITSTGELLKAECGKSHPVYSDRKVLATNDPQCKLPNITQSDIDFIVSNGLSSVEIEMQRVNESDGYGDIWVEYPLLQDGCVKIVRDSWEIKVETAGIYMGITTFMDKPLYSEPKDTTPVTDDVIQDEFQFNQEVRRRITELCGNEYILANLKQDICMYVMQMYRAGAKYREAHPIQAEGVMSAEEWFSKQYGEIPQGKVRKAIEGYANYILNNKK